MMRKSILALISLLEVSLLGKPARSSIGASHILHKGIENITTYTAADYVQDGLAYLWDGIENVDWGEHDPSATYWTELISGNAISISGTLGNQYGWSDKSLVNKSGSRFYMDISARMLSSVKYGKFSYEIATSSPVESATWNAQVVNIAPASDTAYNHGISMVVRKESSGQMQVDGYSTYQTGGYMIPQDPAGLFTISVVYDGSHGWCYINGTMLKDAGKQITPDVSIGGAVLRFPARSYPFRGHYHCLRIYNRMLSEEEIAYNYELDLRRFGDAN